MRPIMLLLLLLSHAARAQFFEDFSNYETADLLKYWLGDTQNFQINSENELQLYAPAAGQSLLVHRNFLPDSIDFEIRFRLEFAPSLQNQLRIYLQADTANLLIANGFFIEIGETGSEDALRFFKQENGQATLLASGKTGAVGSDPVETTLKITRREGGKWQCWLGDVASGTAVAQFSATENLLAGAKNLRFGIHCKYTDSRRDAFYFQKIAADWFRPDLTPPSLLKVETLNDTTARMDFSEPVDSSILQTGNISFYNLTGDERVEFVTGTRAAVLVFTKVQFLKGSSTKNVFSINGLRDDAGNEAAPIFSEVQHFQTISPQSLYLIFNEIMADPTPSNGLPEVEWLEILNNSNDELDLGGVTLSDESGKTAVFPKMKLSPKKLLLVVPAGAPDFNSPGSEVVELPDFPSLNNDRDRLILKNAAGDIVDVLEYSSDWHTDPGKANGGYSLERRNPHAPCLGRGNWGTSKAISGATPGARNTLEKIEKDTVRPRPIWAFPVSADRILVKFSKGMSRAGVDDFDNYYLPGHSAIDFVEFSELDRKAVVLHLAKPLPPGKIFDLYINEKVFDCTGNSVFYPKNLKVGLPEPAENQDIVINEILFDPHSGGSRFVEILNRSSKVLSLEDLFLADRSNGGAAVYFGQQRLFAPGDLLVLATDTADIFQNFKNVKPENLLRTSLPTFDEDAGNCTIFSSKNGQSVVLDSFNFSKKMHNALLSDDAQEGTSLERIRADAPTNRSSNWASAAAQDTFQRGTPTRPNSQRREDKVLQYDEFISLMSNRLSPDGDGRDDFLEIRFDLPRDGFAATFSIFDSDGRLVKKLVRQDLIGTSGTVRWDGDGDDGAGRVRPGIHVLFAEIFHPDGSVRRQKLVFSVVF